MKSSFAILCCVLMTQAAGDTSPSPDPVGAESAGESGRQPPDTDSQPAAESAGAQGRVPTPRDMVTATLTMPEEGGALSGRPLPLIEALSAAYTARGQLEVTHAYWRLTRLVAEYRLCLNECQRLGEIAVAEGDTAMLNSARTSASVARRMAELDALAAQHDLAEAALLSSTASLPLPADTPFVGEYETHFEDGFALQNPPARARLIDRNLPIRGEMIELRASALLATEDSLQAAAEAYHYGKANLPDVLGAVREVGRQYRALLEAVCQYNHDIAEYALAVAGPQNDKRVLVTMLIGESRKPAGSSGTRQAEPSDTRRASAELWQSGPSDVQRAIMEEAASPRHGPTLAPLRGGLRSLSSDEPELNPPHGFDRSVDDDGDPATASDEAPQEPSDTSEATPEESVVEPPMVPITTPTPRTAYRPVVDENGNVLEDMGFYSALIEARPAVRAKHLTLSLHGNSNLPEGSGESIELAQCLAGLSQADRRRVIAAYWLTRQRAAEYQALAQQVQFLEELATFVIERRNEPSGAEAMLHVRAAELAAEADLLQARLELLDAQFQLTNSMGLPLDSPWLLPATVPHSGSYELQLEAQPRELVESWSFRRLAATIPALADALLKRAASVVEADTTRASATVACQTGTKGVDDVLASIKFQTDQTLAFLDGLTKYNQAIGDYALTVLPPAISGEQLADRLVVR